MGKKHTTKYTIQDSQQSFMYIAKTVQDMEEWLNVLKTKKTSIHPFVYGIGKDILNIKEYYAYMDGVTYKFFNMVSST